MAYREPSGVVEIFSGVPLDNSYAHTVYFASASERDNFFSSYSLGNKRTYDAQSYTRIMGGKMRLQMKEADYIAYNYLRFRDAAVNTRWIYAFITHIEYVSDFACDIEYEIDEVMTWQNAMNLPACFVERETTQYDTVYQHTMPEPVGSFQRVTIYRHMIMGGTAVHYNSAASDGFLGTGKNTWQGADDTKSRFQLVMLFAEPPFDQEGWFTGSGSGFSYEQMFLAGNMPTPNCHAVVAETWAGAVSMVRNVTALGVENMLSCYLRITPKGQHNSPGYGDDMAPYMVSFPRLLPETVSGGIYPSEFGNAFGGYRPKNKKLYSYPYCSLMVSNLVGSEMDLMPDRFTYIPSEAVQQVYFRCGGDYTPGGEYVICPLDYNKGERSRSNSTKYEHALFLPGLPSVPIAKDSYQAWLAMNKSSVATSNMSAVMSGLLSATVGAATENPAQVAQAAIGTATALANSANAMNRAKMAPPVTKGATSGNGMYGFNRYGFMGFWETLNYEDARAVDDFFSRYGYALNEVKTPYYHGRPHWNFIKTDGCVVKGNIPQNAKKTIAQAFDNGITWWKNMSEVGNFALDNSI